MHNLSDKPHFHHSRMSDDGGPEPDLEIAAELDRVFGPEAQGANTKPAHKPPLGDAMVVLPKHYNRFEIEPIHFAVTNRLDQLEATAIKYIMRAPYKHDDKGRQDYLKAIRCIIMKAKKELGDPDWWKPYLNTSLQHALEAELYDGS